MWSIICFIRSKFHKMDKKTCKLCENEAADKENSHIIPKFLSKGLFENTKPRHSLELKKNGKGRNIQDTPKENNILCKSCEKRIEIIETYFARKIVDIHNYKNQKEKFVQNKIASQEFLICKNINPKAFKLFIYSIIWRASISNLNEFLKFKIEKNIENEIRHFLNKNLKKDHKELLEDLKEINSTPDYNFVVFKPIINENTSRGIFTAFNTGPNSHLLMIVDFAIYFFADENNLDFSFRYFSNKQNEFVIIALADIEKWNELNKNIVYKMLKNKSS